MESIAIIGSGIAGLGTAWFLRHDFELTVFEGDDHVGGHANTVEVREGDRRVPIDTGFMVFNHVTYPHLVRLFRALDVPTKPTDMSFSVRHAPRDVEFRGTSLNHLFAQRRNLLRPAFYRLLRQIDRFNREAVPALSDSRTRGITLAEYVAARGYGDDFLNLYLVPMSSAVWSTPPEQMLRFPTATLLQFFHNHGFLGLHTQHPWWTVEGGSRTYVAKLTAPFRDRIRRRTPVRAVRRVSEGVEVVTDTATTLFDRVVLACHPPAALALLGSGSTAQEREILGHFRYHPNTATLHGDNHVMPERRLAWSAWNYRVEAGETGSGRTSTHYWMNRLQQVSPHAEYFVSINGVDLVRPGFVHRTIAYEHPLFDLAARKAQTEVPALNALGDRGTRTYFVGAWQRYGFHEDGLLSAVELAGQLLQRDPWLAPEAVLVS